MAAALRRPRSQTEHIDGAVLTRLLKEQGQRPGGLNLGGYMKVGGPFPEVVERWAPCISELLETTPTAILCWDEVKAGFIEIFNRHPRMDPHLKKDGSNPVASAEESASALKRMMHPSVSLFKNVSKTVVKWMLWELLTGGGAPKQRSMGRCGCAKNR